MFKELKQLNDGAKPGTPVVIPTCPDKLSSREKSEALEAVNLIKIKRDGNIKGRTCANGAKQRQYAKEGDNYSSPTAALESIIATLIVDAMEDRAVSIADIPGAYLHAKLPPGKNILLKLTERINGSIIASNPRCIL